MNKLIEARFNRWHETEMPNYCALDSYAALVPQFKALLEASTQLLLNAHRYVESHPLQAGTFLNPLLLLLMTRLSRPSPLLRRKQY